LALLIPGQTSGLPGMTRPKRAESQPVQVGLGGTKVGQAAFRDAGRDRAAVRTWAMIPIPHALDAFNFLSAEGAASE
jgi:hypothetical protein